MNDIKRFALQRLRLNSVENAEMQESETGEWVRFEDVKNLIAPSSEEVFAFSDGQFQGVASSLTENEAQALRDMLEDARLDLSLIAEVLQVPYEPHQTFRERALLKAVQAGSLYQKAQELRDFFIVAFRHAENFFAPRHYQTAKELFSIIGSDWHAQYESAYEESHSRCDVDYATKRCITHKCSLLLKKNGRPSEMESWVCPKQGTPPTTLLYCDKCKIDSESCSGAFAERNLNPGDPCPRCGNALEGLASREDIP